MPLPVVMSVGAVLAGNAGLGSGVHGTVRLKSANDTMKIVQHHSRKDNAVTMTLQFKNIIA